MDQVSLSYLDESTSTVSNRVHCISEVQTGKEKVQCFLIGTDRFIFVASFSMHSKMKNELQLMQVVQTDRLGLSAIHKILPDGEVIRFIDIVLGKCLVIKSSLELTSEKPKWWKKDYAPLRVLINQSPTKHSIYLDSPEPTQKHTLIPDSHRSNTSSPQRATHAGPSMPTSAKSGVDAIDSPESSTYTISVPDTISPMHNHATQSSDMNIDSCLQFSLSRPQSKLETNKEIENNQKKAVSDSPHEQGYRSLQLKYEESFTLDMDISTLGYFRPASCLIVNQQVSLGLNEKSLCNMPAEITPDSLLFYKDDGSAISFDHRAGENWKHSNNHGIHFRYCLGIQWVVYIAGEDIIILDTATEVFSPISSILSGVSYMPFTIAVGHDGTAVACISAVEQPCIELRYSRPSSDSIRRSNLQKICKIELISL
jgi:hypothetical protein